jgi:hypothetical protein
MRKTLIAAALMATFSMPAAHANLISLGPIDQVGTGLGAVSTILTVQAKGTSTDEAGSVFANGAGQSTSGDTIAINSLRTFSELGVTDAANLAIVFNPSESQAAGKNGITLNDLTLQIFNPTTSDLVFSSGHIGPVNFDANDAGTGKAGFLFQFDDAQATAVNAVLAAAGAASGSYRIGLTSSLSNADGGVETFYGANIVPEPGTWAMLMAGLVGIIGLGRRRLS